MRKVILKKAMGNGLSFVFNSIVIAAWYYLITQKAEPEIGSKVLIAMSIAGLINLLDLGSSLLVLNFLSSKEVHQTWSPRHIVFSTLVGCGVAELVLGGGGLAVWKVIDQADYSWADLIGIVLFAITTQILQTSASVFRGLFDFAKANLLTLLTSILVYGVACIFLIFRADPRNVFYYMAFSQACCAALAILLILKNNKLVSYKSQSMSIFNFFKCFIFIIRNSIYFFPQVFSGIFFLHVQRFVVMSSLGASYVGNYSFGYALATRLHAVLNSFFDLLFPYAKQFVGDDKSVLSFSAKTGAVAALLCAFSACVLAYGLWIFAPNVLTIYSYYVIGVVFAMFMAPSFHILNGIGGMRFVSACSLLTPVIFLVVVGLSSVFISNHMAYAIPAAYCIAMIILMLMLLVVLKKIDRKRFA